MTAHKPRGFMCAVDFDHEVGCASGGNHIFPDLDDLKAHKPCWSSCGVVEVELTMVRRVIAEDFSDIFPKAPE